MTKITFDDGTELELSKEVVDKIVKEYKEEFPQVGDEYWYVGCIGDVWSDLWDDFDLDRGLKDHNNIYRTKKDAEMAAIRDRGMRCMPKLFREIIIENMRFYQPNENDDKWQQEYKEAFIYCNERNI